MLLNPQDWVPVEVPEDVVVNSKETGERLFITRTFEVQNTPRGMHCADVRIRPVCNDEFGQCNIEECGFIECATPIEKVSEIYDNLPKAIMDLYKAYPNIFDQNRQKVHMTPGTRPESDFPDEFAAYRVSENDPIIMFRRKENFLAKCNTLWTFYDIKRIVSEIYNVTEIAITNYRSANPPSVPKGCVLYVNCEAGDMIQKDDQYFD